MAVPTTRKLFKDYCLRRLGYPVIDINVDDGQVDDRIDDALAYYRDFHFDGTEHIYLSYKITQTDVNNKFITLPDNINYVIRIFDIGRASSVSNLFNVRYQIHLNDLFDFTSTTYVPYVMGMRHIEELEQIFVGSKPIRFNRHNNCLYVDMKWDKDVKVDDYVIVDCYRVLDSEAFSDVWSDPWLKKYASALIKKQWGENLKKFEGMNLPGGVKFNGQKIWDEANDEINALEKEMNSGYSLPVMDMMN
jgi:hypothetical protein